MNRIRSVLNKYCHVPHWLFAIIAFAFLLHIPSLIEPYYYGDELIYLTLGNGIRQGLTLYKDIHDNKPPLLYMVAAISENLFWFRAIATFWAIASIAAISKLSQSLRPKDTRFQVATTIAFAVGASVPLLEGHIANAENFMIFFVIVSVCLLLKKSSRFYVYLLSGLLLSLATLFKVPAFSDIGVLVPLILYPLAKKEASILNVTRRLLIFIFGIILPIAAFLIWYLTRGAGKEFVEAAFLQNLGYVSSWKEGAITTGPSALTKLTPILIRAGVAGASILLVIALYLKKKISPTVAISSIWLASSLFGITLSERPYPHYILQALPPLALLIGLLFSNKSKYQPYVVLPIFLTLSVIAYYKFWQYETRPYFQNMMNLSLDRDISDYRQQYGAHVVRTYELASYIQRTTNKADRVFVWEDSASLYALSRRLPPIKYVAGYHIHDFSSLDEVARQIEEHRPKMIVVYPESTPFPELMGIIERDYQAIYHSSGTIIAILK